MKSICFFLLLWPVVALTQTTPYQWHLQTGLGVVPPASFRPTMAYDTVRGVTLCILTSTNLNRDFRGTWRWDGSEWTPPTDASSTECNDPVQIGFDSVRGVAILYCLSGRTVDDILEPGITWEWDGSLWRLASTNSPQNRDNMGMAFDSRRGRTIIFGGSFGFAGPVPPWTSEWDGTIWRVVATNGPSRRTECAMAYDAKRHVTLLFGGRDESDIPKRDTWSWDGTNWTAVSVAGPVARRNHGMVYDSVRERVLLYGGLGEEFTVGTNGLGDLWEWDGSQWLFSSTNGPRHYDPAMAFDSQRGEAVVWGGSRDFVELRETWLLKLHETWVDFSYAGSETGTFNSPFNTLSEGVAFAPSGGALKIKAGSTPESLTIAKRLSVQAFGGSVTIGP